MTIITAFLSIGMGLIMLALVLAVFGAGLVLLSNHIKNRNPNQAIWVMILTWSDRLLIGCGFALSFGVLSAAVGLFVKYGLGD